MYSVRSKPPPEEEKGCLIIFHQQYKKPQDYLMYESGYLMNDTAQKIMTRIESLDPITNK